MFQIEKEIIIEKDSEKYLSFPDIIKSKVDINTFFIVYRSGDSHHPTYSELIIQKSEDKGMTWKHISSFSCSLEEDGMVWNCPRFSYIDNSLYIICDTKNGTKEREAQFKIFFLKSDDDGKTWETIKTPMPGMVPDKIIPFIGKLFCANHKIKNEKNELIQLVSWTRDNEDLWYNTNVLANCYTKQFCEASIVNMGEYLIAYLRDNSGNCKNIYTVQSNDGINWSMPKRLPILGQRVTALRDGENIIGAYRNTTFDYESLGGGKRYVSIFEHNLKTNEIIISNIDWEFAKNQYHFGYTGIEKLDNDYYLLVYYIKQRSRNPYIKLTFIRKY